MATVYVHEEDGKDGVIIIPTRPVFHLKLIFYGWLP